MKPLASILLASALLGLGVAMAAADPSDLSDGVYIAHHDPAISWTTLPPPGALCQEYLDQHAIASCADQNPSIMLDGNQAWYVLAQWWNEDKVWCLSEFGFGEFDRDLFVFVEWGPCTPGGNLEISTGAWPGPISGTAVTTTDIPWSGNFTPVYYFFGYGYATPGQIPLALDPTEVPFAGFVNCLTPPQAYSATCLPALGVGMPGAECCSEPPTQPDKTSWGTIKTLYR